MIPDDELQRTYRAGVLNAAFAVIDSDEQRSIVRTVLEENLLHPDASGLRAIAAEAWDEACMAFGWALDNGEPVSAAAYVAGTNPYKPAVSSGSELLADLPANHSSAVSVSTPKDADA